MSVGEEQTECPLCMEPLEMDDINFFPCTCGYQICRFCWHRIRTDENGLCPACRKQYPEDPAEFKPLTEDELQRIKKERRQKDLQRKQKAAENRKHLANVRVVQRNLVFVVGLSQRLADPEVLKKHEYFGKFGKIHKVVINHSTSYAGAQGPSASAYVTYHKPEDALRGIQAVNNIFVDGRTLKASLGTTKYCSHFLRGAQCPKPDCMYLHELGEEAASFTKEEMQQGKHQEYEQRLYEGFMNSQNLSNAGGLTLPNTPTLSSSPPASSSPPVNSTINSAPNNKAQRKKNSSPTTVQQSGGGGNAIHPPPNTNKEAWPSLNSSGNNSRSTERLTNGNGKGPHPTSQSPTSLSSSSSSSSSTPPSSSCLSSSPPLPSDLLDHSQELHNGQNRAPGHHRSNSHPTETVLLQQIHSHPGHNTQNSQSKFPQTNGMSNGGPLLSHNQSHSQKTPPLGHKGSAPPSQGTSSSSGVPSLMSVPVQTPVGLRRSPFDPVPDSMSLFSNNGFSASRNPKPPVNPVHSDGIATTEIPDTIPVRSTTDWQAAFGFSSANNQTTGETHDDDLGFDPWDESSKGLADLLEKESFPPSHGFLHGSNLYNSEQRLGGSLNGLQQHHHDQRIKNLPPGFAPNHIGAYNNQLPRPGVSKLMGLHFPHTAGNMNSQSNSAYHDMLSDINHPHQPQQDWQDGLRALLPNINISFGAASPASSSNGGGTSSQQTATSQQQQHQQQQQQQPRPHHHKDWSSSSSSSQSLSWDPAIVISGNVTDSTALSDDPPHWMASLHHLTEDNTNHRLPFVHQFPFRGPTWAPQTQNPPPGFHQNHITTPTRVPEAHRLAEGLQ